MFYLKGSWNYDQPCFDYLNKTLVFSALDGWSQGETLVFSDVNIIPYLLCCKLTLE